MEVVKVIKGDYKNESALKNVVEYATNPDKTMGYIGGYGVNPCNPDAMVEQMYKVKEIFDKQEGYRQVRHFVVSFEPEWQVTAETAWRIGYEIAACYMNRYQICFGVHLDTEHIHIHFVMNTVSYIDGKLYSGGWSELSTLKQAAVQVIGKYVPAVQAELRGKILET